MYWGEARLDGAARALYRGLHRLKRINCAYEGHVKASRYFWGDLCRDRVAYVRNLVFPEINYDRIDKVRGMDIIVTTTAKTDDEARELLRLFNFPFPVEQDQKQAA